LLDGIAIHVAMPSVTIQTPSVPTGTYTISKVLSVDTLNTYVHSATGKNLDEVTDIVLEGVTINIVMPDTLTFSSFSYAKLIVSAGASSVTVFDTPLSISSRSYPYTLSASIKNVISAARSGNGKITYSYTVTTTKSLPVATWKITTNAAITP
jgi:uroporphyrinogen-III decarboxylase